MRMVMFNSMAGISMIHVPYKSSPMTDLMSGQVAIAFEPATTAIPFIKSGKLRALAVTSARRQAALPDVPTVAETLPAFAHDGWMALVVPAGTPGSIVERLNTEAAKILKSDDVRTRIAELGLQTVGGSITDCAALMRAESDKWGKLARQYNIRVD